MAISSSAHTTRNNSDGPESGSASTISRKYSRRSKREETPSKVRTNNDSGIPERVIKLAPTGLFQTVHASRRGATDDKEAGACDLPKNLSRRLSHHSDSIGGCRSRLRDGWRPFQLDCGISRVAGRLSGVRSRRTVLESFRPQSRR